VIEEQVPDDRGAIAEGDRVVLIVEDDVTFASILLEMAHDKGFKGVVATRGESGLQLAKRYSPRCHHRSTSLCPTWKVGRCSTA